MRRCCPPHTWTAEPYLTHNRKHFRNLHKAGIPHSGLVLCTEDPDFDSLAARVDLALSITSELTGRLIRVTRPPG